MRRRDREPYEPGSTGPAPGTPRSAASSTPVPSTTVPRRSRMRRRQRQAEPKPPWYSRVLRLRNLAPGSVACFIFLEGSIALAALLAFAELVSWWAVIVLPVTVAAMVKLNDYVAGKLRT